VIRVAAPVDQDLAGTDDNSGGMTAAYAAEQFGSVEQPEPPGDHRK